MGQRKKIRAVGLGDIQTDGSFQPCESHLLRDDAARWMGQKVRGRGERERSVVVF